MKKILIVLIVVAVAGFVFYKVSSKTKPLGPQDALRAVLLNKKSADFQVRDALVQLAYYQDPDALTFALERAGSENPKIRAGVGETLGFYETSESEAALLKLLDDSDSAVRLQTIRGLYHVKTPARLALIRKQLAEQNLSETDRLKLKEVLFRASDDPKDKKDSVEALVAFARSGKTDQHLQAGLMAASLSPKDAGVMKYVREMARQGQEPAFVSTAIYLFSDARDPEISGNLRKYLKDPQPSVRVAAASTVYKYCQKDRFAALKERLLVERDPMVVRTIADSLKMMPGPTAAAIAESTAKSGALTGDSLKAIEEAWSVLRSGTRGSDPCERIGRN